MPSSRNLLYILSLNAVCAGLGQAQDPRLKTIKVADRIYMLQGNGGNIGLSVGKSGAFLIDDQFAPIVPQIKAAVAKLSETPVKFVVNTHWHGDHTGGNERLGKAGALIYAHDNVRKRMTADQLRKQVKNKTAALPVVTFDQTLTFHWNDETIHAFHVARAHTDGDAIIHFKQANVVHMGDVMFNGRFPFIDVKSGGSIDGLIAAVTRVLAMVDDKTKIIPGHGDLASRADLKNYLAMLTTVSGRIGKLVAAGKSEQEVVDSKPCAEYEKEWTWGFINAEKFTKAIFLSHRLQRSRALEKSRRLPTLPVGDRR